MRTFAYLSALQFRMDYRSRDVLVTYYIVPLLFYIVMGFVFTSILPDAEATLAASMTVMGVSLGGYMGLASTVCAATHGALRDTMCVNGISAASSVGAAMVSAQAHLTVLSAIILLTAGPMFDAPLPDDLGAYCAALELLILATDLLGVLVGLLVRDQSRLAAAAQIVFLPSVLLSGIMFPASMLPEALQGIGEILPATSGYELLTGDAETAQPLALIVCALAAADTFVLWARGRRDGSVRLKGSGDIRTKSA